MNKPIGPARCPLDEQHLAGEATTVTKAKGRRSGEPAIADLSALLALDRATIRRVLERPQDSMALSTSGGQ
ncbi:hypothetical protein [Streptomyces sp. NPDC057438]|uniref:hypothetical protein n=1 Tax=Streptomyces sp. NPDC057438 TaxID=3346133 RepID=UPI00367EDC7F